jgi:hypothetical protein
MMMIMVVGWLGVFMYVHHHSFMLKEYEKRETGDDDRMQHEKKRF